MRRNLWVVVLGTALLSVLVGGIGVAGSNLDALVAHLKGADTASRRQIMRSLSEADRKQLHAEYRALSAEGKRAVDDALGRRKAKPAGQARQPLGTVQYDTHTVHSFRDDSSDVVGNQFNVGFGNPHTISLVSFLPLGTFGSIALRAYDAPVGTVAAVLASTTFPGTVTLLTWDLPDIVNHSGSFLVGMQQSGSSSTISPTVAAIAVDINNGGFGFHGMNIKLNGSGFIPNATVFPGLPYNAILRVTGGNLPVELMNFDLQ